MNKMKLFLLLLCYTVPALSLDLYVDQNKQLFSEPGPGRTLLGSFEKSGDQTEISKIKQDIELRNNEIKSLEEHVAAVREDKAKNDEKWFNKINLRGYTQLRYNQPLSGDRGQDGRPEIRNPSDGGIKNNSSFSFRRVRLVFSGDVNDYVSLYLQPDFSASVSSDIDNQNFAQLRDAYADLHFDKKHEYRIRAGQSKIPFGWENLQSSQNRLTLDRADALNSAVPSERDLGLIAYWTPTHVQKLWKDLSKKGLKTSGDYGILGLGVYNGQGINRGEKNDDLYMVAHSTYPILLDFLGTPFSNQVLEVGADYINGKFDVSTGDMKVFDTGAKLSGDDIESSKSSGGMREERVGVHAVLFPQPFGLQAEWNWGYGPGLDPSGTGSITKQSLSGGYVQAMYKIDNVFRSDGAVIPFVKWQTYKGPYKGATNSPLVNVQELDIGVEYQIMKALELTMTYAYMDRTNTRNLGQAQGDMLRFQAQWNY